MNERKPRAYRVERNAEYKGRCLGQFDVEGLGRVRLVWHVGDDESIYVGSKICVGKDYDRASEEFDAKSEVEKTKRIEKQFETFFNLKHFSVFEQSFYSFEFSYPIFTDRHFMRYRSAHPLSVSGRYCELDSPTFAGRFLEVEPGENELRADGEILTKAFRDSAATYRYLLDLTVPKEVARTVLPTATQTLCRFTVDLRNLIHILEERLAPAAQLETQAFARAMKKFVDERNPIVGELLDKSLEGYFESQSYTARLKRERDAAEFDANALMLETLELRNKIIELERKVATR